MNIACSTCMESFTAKCNVSSTPCGHVFHTNCIMAWLQTDQNKCPQCRKWCTIGQIHKIHFSEVKNDDALQADLKCIELVEEKQRLEKEISELKAAQLQCQKMHKWLIKNTKDTNPKANCY